MEVREKARIERGDESFTAGELVSSVAVLDNSLFFFAENVISHIANFEPSADERTAALDQECLRLQKGETTGACAYLEALADWVQRGLVPLPELRETVDRLALALIGAALQTELPAPVLRDFYRRVQPEERSMGELIRCLCTEFPAVVRELCRLQETQSDLLDRMIAYIGQYGMRYDFSIQAMADAFAIPQPELSRLFQSRTGRKLGVYLWEQRLQEAKRLLIDTEYPVREVVQRVGYVDTSSFTRKFRRCTGCTPGEYRMYYRRLQAAAI